MAVIMQQLELLERMDRLIRCKATGTGSELATKLRISKTKLYRMLNVMKQLNAPVEYDESIKSFVYAEEVGLVFGFYPNGPKVTKFHPVA